MPEKKMFVTILPVLNDGDIFLPTQPENGMADCIKCSINGEETLSFSTVNINAHTRHHLKSGGVHSDFVITANFAPKES